MIRGLLLLGALVGCRSGVPPRTPPPEESPAAAYEDLLGTVVSADGYVDWEALRADRGPLDDYVAWLGQRRAVPNSYSGSFPLYLNAYNAFVLYGMLEQPELPDSVLDVSGWVPKAGSGFFLEKAFLLGGEWVSLFELEHERVRLRNEDFRAHAALNCASMSCPPMRRTLYERVGLSQILDRQMRTWINDPERGVKVEHDVAVFNPIWDWYAFDFEAWSGGKDPCKVAERYANGPLRAELSALSTIGCPRRFTEYDWRRNDVRTARAEGLHPQ